MNEENNVKKKKIIKGAICASVGLAIVIGGVCFMNVQKNKEELAQLEIEEQQKKAEEEKEKAIKEAEEKAQKEIQEITEKAEKEIESIKEETEKQVEESKNSTSTSTVANNTVYVADVQDHLSLRFSASTNSEVLARLNPYTEMTILENTNDDMVFVNVNSGDYVGFKGYVNKNYIVPKGSPVTRTNNVYTVFGTERNLPMRSQPVFDDTYLCGWLVNGEKVAVLERTNDQFWKVQDIATTGIGYVACKYLVKTYY